MQNTGKKEKAVLVGLITKWQDEEQAMEYIEELEFLAKTAGAHTMAKFTQKLETPDVRSFVGKGKLNEIKSFVKQNKIDVVIFDDDLSPSQLRNIEQELKVGIYDRSLLILEIFLQRARTAQAKTQVELARYQYLMPRLTRMWTHLERQRGGTGTRGGAGEKEIETDRRIIRDQIALLKKKLEKIEKQSKTRRKSREGMVRVALVGYTNVGKSTLMNLFTNTDILAENKLFATVDSTVRKMVIDGIPFLITDTVGFIRKLPHHLIESFKSTLDEIREADILLHVVDISHPSFEEHSDVVQQTLTDIGAGDKPTIMVYNKIDLYRSKHEENGTNNEEAPGLDQLRNSYLGNGQSGTVFISARKRENIEELRTQLIEEVKKKFYTIYPNYLEPVK